MFGEEVAETFVGEELLGEREDGGAVVVVELVDEFTWREEAASGVRDRAFAVTFRRSRKPEAMSMWVLEVSGLAAVAIWCAIGAKVCGHILIRFWRFGVLADRSRESRQMVYTFLAMFLMASATAIGASYEVYAEFSALGVPGAG